MTPKKKSVDDQVEETIVMLAAKIVWRRIINLEKRVKALESGTVEPIDEPQSKRTPWMTRDILARKAKHAAEGQS